MSHCVRGDSEMPGGWLLLEVTQRGLKHGSGVRGSGLKAKANLTSQCGLLGKPLDPSFPVWKRVVTALSAACRRGWGGEGEKV